MSTNLRVWPSRSLEVVVETNSVDIFRSRKWRMKATVDDFYDRSGVDSSDDPLTWDVDIFYLFSDRECTKRIDIDGNDAISSGFTKKNAFFGDKPRHALTPPEVSKDFWGGLPDENNDYWLGFNRDCGPILPKCVRIRQLNREGGSPMKSVQIEASKGGNWQSVYTINDLCCSDKKLDREIPFPDQPIAKDPPDSFFDTRFGEFLFATGIISILFLISYCGYRLGLKCDCNCPDISC